MLVSTNAGLFNRKMRGVSVYQAFLKVLQSINPCLVFSLSRVLVTFVLTKGAAVVYETYSLFLKSGLSICLMVKNNVWMLYFQSGSSPACDVALCMNHTFTIKNIKNNGCMISVGINW